MTLTTCPECGREISGQAHACPHCGYPMQEEFYDEEIEPSQTQSEMKPEFNGESFLARILLRLQLTKVELWTIMVGCIVVCAVIFAVTFYWWKNLSPRAKFSLYQQSESAYSIAIDREINYFKTAPQITGNPQWSTVAVLWFSSAEVNKKFIDTFPEELLPRSKAFQRMCDSYYHLAAGYEKNGDQVRSTNAYRAMISCYENYLDYLNNLANRLVSSGNPADAFIDAGEQRTALKRIAIARSKIMHFDSAIEKLEDFIERYPGTDDAAEASIQLANTYVAWAKDNLEQEPNLVRKAIDIYQEIIQNTPENGHQRRMRMHVSIGQVKLRLYERNKKLVKDEEAYNNLCDAIASYENADRETRLIGTDDNVSPDKPDAIEETLEISKQLGDLYLKQGNELALKWQAFEDQQKMFPDSSDYKEKLQDAAEREKTKTRDALAKAITLYDELLTKNDFLDQSDFENIYYNKTKAYYTLRDYAKTLDLGETFLNGDGNSIGLLSPDIKTKLHYLLGNAAWEDALTTQNYTKVQEHYLAGLQLDPLYPAETYGEESNLAEIRLINACYLPEKKYEEAIERFQKAIERFPQNSYTFLTLVWYASTLEEYGDELMDQVRQKEEKAGAGDNTAPQVGALQNRAKELFSNAVTICQRAIEAREKSKYIDAQNRQYLIRCAFAQGHCAFKAERYQDAEQYWSDALENFGDSQAAQPYIPDAMEKLGDAYIKLGRFQKAIANDETFLQRFPGDPRTETIRKRLAGCLAQALESNQN